MSTQILNKKVGGLGLVDLGVIAISKFGGEIILSPLVGNTTLKSGVIKLVLAGLATKANKNVGVGVALDGAEDLVIGSGVRDMVMGAVTGNKSEGGF